MNKNEKCEEPATPESPSIGELPEQVGKEVRVPYWKSPPPLPSGHDIPPRQYIPLVPEGEEVPDDTPSGPVELD